MELLWVRWYDVDSKAQAGFEARRQFQVKFRSANSFGFVDPANVLRATHLIPNFYRGRTDQYLGPSISRREDEGDKDYERYYVNMFVDRDMFMRYTGGGIGHLSTRTLTRGFEMEVRRIWGTVNDEESASDIELDPGIEDGVDNQAAAELTRDEGTDPFSSPTDDGVDNEEWEDNNDDDSSDSDKSDNEQADDGDCNVDDELF
ncbi:hypothetical protein H0H93_000922 [Arthromyces matolae]|nr:hypothetical protein H0H93_000922 [Arthromyces matolae]